MMRERKTVQISMRLDSELYQELKKLSKEIAIPYTVLIKHAITVWLKQRKNVA